MQNNSETIPDIFFRTAAQYASNTAFVFVDRRFSYGEYDELSNRVANGLVARGIKAGDRVAINLPNLPQYLIFMLGALKAGCIISGLSPLASAREMEWQLKDLGASVLISFDDVYAKHVQNLIGSLPALRLVVVTRPLDLMPAPIRFFARLLRKLPHPRIDFADAREIWFREFLQASHGANIQVKQEASSIAAIQYTGGTTGQPKGAILTHANLLSNIQQGIEVTRPEVGRETGLSIFPFFHIAGLTAALNTIVIAGSWLLVPNPRDLGFIVRQLKKYRPSLIFAVPLLYEKLIARADFKSLRFSFLKFAMSGAAPMPDGLKQALEKLIGVPVLEGYGMTEAAPGVTINYPGKMKAHSVGQALPGTRLKIISLDDSQEASPDSEGELIVAGPQVMQCYWHNDTETAIALRNWQGEQWLFTGDIARIDTDGYVSLVDRLKDMVNVGGYKVFSMELEAVIGEHPVVLKCAILAEPSATEASELVKLVIERRAEFLTVDQNELRQSINEYCRANLAPYKIPKIIQFVDAIPLTPIGKVDKKTLRAELAATETKGK